MDKYIKLLSEVNSDLAFVLRDIVKKREQDVDDFDFLDTRFVRKSAHIPSASNDVLSTDIFNDMSYDAATGYLYIFGNNAGTPEWRRIQLATF